MNNDRDLKTGGRVFRHIKTRYFSGKEHIKPEAYDKVGDIFCECNDGWFMNMRLGSSHRTNILQIDGFEEYYEEINYELYYAILAYEEQHKHWKSAMAATREARLFENQQRDMLRQRSEALYQFAEYQVGDRVLVEKLIRTGRFPNYEFIDGECFIGGIMAEVKNGRVEYFYRFNKIKKDGTMSVRQVDGLISSRKNKILSRVLSDEPKQS